MDKKCNKCGREIVSNKEGYLCPTCGDYFCPGCLEKQKEEFSSIEKKDPVCPSCRKVLKQLFFNN